MPIPSRLMVRRRRLARAAARLARAAAATGMTLAAAATDAPAQDSPAQDSPAGADATGPVVRAVLFFSPTCPHCEQVMRVDLPSLVARHGDRLVIVVLNSAVPQGRESYEEAIRVLGVPPSRRGVPLLVVGDEHLVGSAEIPERFPAIIDRGLAKGGIDWPALPRVRDLLLAEGLLSPSAPPPDTAPVPAPGTGPPTEEVPAADVPAERPSADPEPGTAPPLEPGEVPDGTDVPAAEPDGPDVPSDPDAQPEPEAQPDLVAPPDPGTQAPPAARGAATRLPAEGPGPMEAPGAIDRFRMDPVGNTASVLVLLAMLGVLGWSLAVAAGRAGAPRLPAGLVPVLVAVGLVVAAYLSWVETTGSEAVCGPVGDCNTVQQSEYARLLGVPVGVLGLVGYLAMLVAWGWARRSGSAAAAPRGGPGGDATPRGPWAWRALWVLAFAATAFSAWLTFLEPFVIGATCAWCLTSALLVTGILVVSTRPAWIHG